MRPAPSVVAAPPLASQIFADCPREADVIWQYAVVGVRARFPACDVVRYPAAQRLIAGVQKGVRHLPSGVHVEWYVAAGSALIHFFDDFAEDSVVVPRRCRCRER